MPYPKSVTYFALGSSGQPAQKGSLMKKSFFASALLLLILPFSSSSQPNGKLQLHFIDVGQGDAEFVVSPKGETILIDGGLPGKDQVVNPYLATNHFTNIDYYIASHYHNDHIGCATRLMTADRVQRLKAAYDRGDDPSDTDSYANPTTQNYLHAVQTKRVTASSSATGSGHKFKLDATSPNPVEVEFFAVNGNGHITNPERNENDFSVACVIRFGNFSAVLGGDLSGSSGSKYSDIETPCVPAFTAPVTVYKVHHHGSQYSSNPAWLQAINPVVGIICCGAKNGYFLPHEDALQRLADSKIDTYWTEIGGQQNPDYHGAATLTTHVPKAIERPPDAGKHQYVGGDIVVEVSPGSDTFDLTTHAPQQTTTTITYRFVKPAGQWGQRVTGTIPPPDDSSVVYKWSSNGRVYHLANCPTAALIRAKNLESGPVPPDLPPHSCVH